VTVVTEKNASDADRKPANGDGSTDDVFNCPPLPPPHEVSGLQASVRGFAFDREMEVVELILPLRGAMTGQSNIQWDSAFVTLAGHLPGAASVVASSAATVGSLGIEERADNVGLGASVYIRRPKAEHDAPIVATLYFVPSYTSLSSLRDGEPPQPSQILHFAGSGKVPAKADEKVLERWARSVAKKFRYLEEGGKNPHWESSSWSNSAWESFAGGRVIDRYFSPTVRRGGAIVQRNAYTRTNELEKTMDLMSGALSIYGALRNSEFLETAGRKPSKVLPFFSVKPAELVKHPFAAMLAELGTEPPVERLAQAAPAEFWYLRAKDLATVFDVSDNVETLGSPVARLLGGSSMNSGLLQRYETQLGLKRNEFSRILGPSLISAVALVGSDAYLKEGTDVTALFELKSPDAFRSALAVMTALRVKEHGGSDVTKTTIEGVEVSQTISKDNAIRQLVAIVGTTGLVSNSLGAITRVLATLSGKHEPLSRESDFRYMLARDAGTPADVLVYMSDRFIAEVAGPRQRILESRRVRAQAELLTPGFAAMLFGYLEGRSPTSKKELLDSGALQKQELVHSDGSAIDFEPGLPPRSVWGDPGFLTPLIDLATPKTVDELEAHAYENWAQQYARTWAGYVDPAALRLAFSGEKGNKLTTDLRVVPLLGDRDYNEFLNAVGEARVTADPITDGIRMLVALSHNAEWRRELNRTFQPDSLVKGLSLDILGDWALVGANDDWAITNALRTADMGYNFCGKGDFSNLQRDLGKVPFFAGVGIASYTGAAIALTAIRQMATSSLGDAVKWEQIGKEHGAPISRVQVGISYGSRTEGGNPEPEFTVFLALLKDAFYVAQSESTLRGLVSAHLDGHGPKSGKARSNAPDQVVLDLTPKRRGAFEKLLLQTLIGATSADNPQTLVYANAMFRGVPELVEHPERFAAMSQSYLGSIPTLPLGDIKGYGPEGLIGVNGDTAIHAKYPSESDLRRGYKTLFDGLLRARASVAFDREGHGTDPVTRSLHTRVELEFKQ